MTGRHDLIVAFLNSAKAPKIGCSSEHELFRIALRCYITVTCMKQHSEEKSLKMNDFIITVGNT
jgi:hypothetical protein